MTPDRPDHVACLFAGRGPNPSDGSVTWCGRPFDDAPRSIDVALPTRHNLLGQPMCEACLYALNEALAGNLWVDPKDPSRARIVAYGGRDFAIREAVYDALDRVHTKYPRMTLVNGRCPAGGADKLAEEWAKDRGVPVDPYPPDFAAAKEAGKPRNYAFVARNQAMVDSGLTGAVEFPGGRGTADMRKRCEGAGLSPWEPMAAWRPNRPDPTPVAPSGRAPGDPCPTCSGRLGEDGLCDHCDHDPPDLPGPDTEDTDHA